MLSHWSTIFGFFANIAGVSAFLALFVPKLTVLYISRFSEKYKTKLAKDLEEFKRIVYLDTERSLHVFKEGLRETANKQERLRIHLEKITDFVSLSRYSLKTAADNSQRLDIARNLLDNISKYEQALREGGFYEYVKKLDDLTEEDIRLHHNEGGEWLCDVEKLLYLFSKDLSTFCTNLGHYGQS